uniref:Auxilin-related protein 2-like n=1 Tax=Tanacetum cinerariifolium TaxID=118510 RepID=A0A6L2KRZ0_TANCI|nr:auxilin-related protein 2-like [Tanacetum cinerariifolium]
MDNTNIDYNAIFNNNEGPKSKVNNLPVYDTDDIFDGLKSVSSFSRNVSGFDELVHGRSSSAPTPESTANTKENSNAGDHPFVVLESTSTAHNAYPSFPTDPLEEIPKFSESGIPKSVGSSVSGSVFDEIDLLENFSNMNNTKMNQSPSQEKSGMNRDRSSVSKDSTQKASLRYSESQPRDASVDGSQESRHTSVNQSTSPPSYTSEHVQLADEIWLTVSEIPLFTQPTRAPPPSRPPPQIPRHISKPQRGSLRSSSSKFGNGLFSPNSRKYPQSPRSYQPAVNSPLSSSLDDLDNFSTNRMPNNIHAQAEQRDSTLAAAAMEAAMVRAEAKFRHAKEVRERENAKASKNKESIQQDRDEDGIQERLRQQREKEEEKREQRRLDKERMGEVERQRARQAVERVTREARERASLEAYERQSAEARLKSEWAAFQRAQAEARERAADGAKDRAERVADEVKEKAEAETGRRAERVAFERVAAEARKRAAAEARDKASTLRMNQQKNDNDLESFFTTSSRPNSAPRPRTTSSDSASDSLSQNRRGAEEAHRTSTTGVPSNLRKASSTSNFIDDLSTIFRAASTSAQFQEVEGEPEERRRARLEREQRTQERAAKALDEKNQRDLQSQREQEERNRIGGTLDAEVKRWAAGKEGNLRALLSSLQYVLWPACGWQPVSLIDLINSANVKKAYRKATLCIHPDKVQQKGATLQQKYVAEKVFDILKEAWNKFNSEELF